MEQKLATMKTEIMQEIGVKVGSYDTYLWYWRVLTPQAITFDPEGVRPYVLHKNCQKSPDLAEYV